MCTREGNVMPKFQSDELTIIIIAIIVAVTSLSLAGIIYSDINYGKGFRAGYTHAASYFIDKNVCPPNLQ